MESDEEALRLSKANEAAWLQVASLAEQVNDLPKAANAYWHVIQQNEKNVHALLQLASISRMQEHFGDAVEHLNRIIAIDGPSGEVLGAIGHCYLTLSQRAESSPFILDCLGKCFDAYDEASTHLGANHDPNLWYGIGLLYERYGALMQPGKEQCECFSAAEEALRTVMHAAPHFEKRAEILYRLGMIYTHQKQPQQALECFQTICEQPPAPLSQADVWFLIGSVQEKMDAPAQEFAKKAYEHVLLLMQANGDPKVSRVYRQLGWVCHKWGLETSLVGPPSTAQTAPLTCLRHALETDPHDVQNWHLLAKCLLDHSDFDGAYDCATQALRLEPSNGSLWATLGALYLAADQTADGIHALEHAVHLDPLAEAWYELGIARHARLTASATEGARINANAVTAAVEAYTCALTACPYQRDDITRRLQQLHSLPTASSQ